MMQVDASIAILSGVTVQRLGELFYASRNHERLKAQGAVEYAPEHYWLIVALHAAWLSGLWMSSTCQPLNLHWLAIFAILQALRLWVLISLKERWTTRIVVLPQTPLITSGPYRFMRHPNYAVVAAEFLVLPFTFGLYAYGITFALANAGVLALRIRAEDRALQIAATPSTAAE